MFCLHESGFLRGRWMLGVCHHLHHHATLHSTYQMTILRNPSSSTCWISTRHPRLRLETNSRIPQWAQRRSNLIPTTLCSCLVFHLTVLKVTFGKLEKDILRSSLMVIFSQKSHNFETLQLATKSASDEDPARLTHSLIWNTKCLFGHPGFLSNGEAHLRVLRYSPAT